MQTLPWASGLLYKMPSAIGGAVRFIQFAYAQAALRKKRVSGARDLFSYLVRCCAFSYRVFLPNTNLNYRFASAHPQIDEDNHLPTPPSDEQVLSDAGLAIGAGSDTTATVLAGSIFYLLSNPHTLTHLRLELESDEGRDAVESLDAGKLGRLAYLGAVLEETMRLQPAVPTALQRAPERGSGGVVVCDRCVWMSSLFGCFYSERS